MMPGPDKISIPPSARQCWPPDIEVFRLAIIVSDPSQVPGRIMKHGFRDIDSWRQMDKASSAINATLWEQTLIGLMKESTPARAMDVLMSGTLCRSDQRPVYLLPDSIL